MNGAHQAECKVKCCGAHALGTALRGLTVELPSEETSANNHPVETAHERESTHVFLIKVETAEPSYSVH